MSQSDVRGWRDGIRISILALAVLCAGASEAAAQSRCTSLEYKLAGKAAAQKTKCKAVAAKAGVAVDPACLAKADTKLNELWTKAESKGDCVTSSDLTAAQAAIDGFVTALMDALEPPPFTGVCCEASDSCWHGFADDAACVQFGGTPGAAGTVCDGATGTCQPPPAGSGQCCHVPQFGVCNGGPDLDLAGCVAAGGLDYPFFATCEPDGSCSLPPLP